MPKIQEPGTAKTTTSLQIEGGCHCQAVRFKAQVDVGSLLLRCNCSICSMSGFEHLMVAHKDFALLSGQAELSQYSFNTCQAKHLFCKICGIKSFYQPRSHPDSWSINTHCIDHFNRADWAHRDFDGRNWQSINTTLNHSTDSKLSDE